MSLNPISGLPELPDGQWWEVRNHDWLPGNPYSLSHYTPRDGYEVCVVAKRVIPARTLPKRFWWEPARREPEKVEDRVLFRRQITDPAKLALRYSSDGIFPRPIGKDVIEPRDVLKAALDIMDEIAEKDAALKRKEASDALLGAYPPKVLPVVGAS